MNNYKIKNKRLRIAYLDFDDIKNPLLGGGQAIATVAVGSRLVKRGHMVTSVCSRFPGYRDRTENGIKYKHIGLGSRFIRLNNIFYILALPFAVLSLDADIIIECFTAPISTLFSPLFAKVPVVGLPSQFQAKEFARKYHLPFALVERIGAKFYRYFLPYTKDVEARMRGYNPNIVAKVVPHGADECYFTIKQKKPKYVLFLGRLDIDQKGIDLLLKAYASIKDKITLPLIIAGHGANEKQVKNLVCKLGLEKYIKFAGPTYGKKKLKVLSEALFVAFPSRHDDLPIFTLEALASGLPLACFNIPELKWADKSIAWKAKPYDIAAYGKVLLKATQDKAVWQMRKNARKYARRFNWDTVASDFELFFRQIVDKKI